MSELKVYHHELRHNEYEEFYLKSEADKVIAELKESRMAWIHRCGVAEEGERHQKYKRCLATADFCESQHDYYNTLGNGFWLVRGDIEKREEYRKKASDFWWKWHNRWLELAEEFKTNNSAANGKIIVAEKPNDNIDKT